MDLANYPACKLSILLGLGYNLKVRGSNPLPATNLLILLNFRLNIFVDSSLSMIFYNNLTYGIAFALGKLQKHSPV